jgi:hypothetical protein
MTWSAHGRARRPEHVTHETAPNSSTDGGMQLTGASNTTSLDQVSASFAIRPRDSVADSQFARGGPALGRAESHVGPGPPLCSASLVCRRSPTRRDCAVPGQLQKALDLLAVQNRGKLLRVFAVADACKCLRTPEGDAVAAFTISVFPPPPAGPPTLRPSARPSTLRAATRSQIRRFP